MSTGFSKVEQKKTSPAAQKRKKAAKQYDQMKSDGMPEFTIFMRIKDKKNWFPVGSLAVNRSSKINDAIFANEKELRQGGFRLFPILLKNQQNLEYGYKLKGSEFADEPIQVAIRPQPGLGNAIQGAIGQFTNRISNIFRRGE